MKKFLPIVIFLAIFLSAFTNTDETHKPNKDNIIVDIKNNSNFDFYALEINVYINEELKTTQGGMNADGSKVKKGESLRFEFIEKDFILEGDATLEVVIVDKENKIKTPINKKLSIELTKNKEYLFEISGDLITESDIKKVN